MADASFLDYVLEQLAEARGIKTRAMFGRAALLRAPVQGPKHSFGRACRTHALGRERSWTRGAAGTGGPAGVAGTRSRVGGVATQHLGRHPYG